MLALYKRFVSDIERWRRQLGVKAKKNPVAVVRTGSCSIAFVLSYLAQVTYWTPFEAGGLLCDGIGDPIMG